MGFLGAYLGRGGPVLWRIDNVGSHGH
jgi:hypothetical protein